jgi:NADP-dependent 3-hydroxy acid dehydrogenase YdfG
MLDLNQQVAIVTGASSGIGKAIATELASRGAVLGLVGRHRETLEVLLQAVSGQGKCYPIDLTSDEQIVLLASSVKRDFKRVDILIHSAGDFISGSMESMPIEELDKLYRLNLRAPYQLTQAMLPMLKASQGQVVFINSSVVLARNIAARGQYAATKNALRAVTDSLRDEVNACGIRVLSIYPGRTATTMQYSINKAEGGVYQPERLLQPGDIAATVVHALSLPKTAEVTDIFIRPMLK